VKCPHCGCVIGSDKQMIILIPSQIERCPKCGKLMWAGGDEDAGDFLAASDAEEEDKDEPA
jgi:hypothetical protein